MRAEKAWPVSISFDALWLLPPGGSTAADPLQGQRRSPWQQALSSRSVGYQQGAWGALSHLPGPSAALMGWLPAGGGHRGLAGGTTCVTAGHQRPGLITWVLSGRPEGPEEGRRWSKKRHLCQRLSLCGHEEGGVGQWVVWQGSGNCSRAVSWCMTIVFVVSKCYGLGSRFPIVLEYLWCEVIRFIVIHVMVQLEAYQIEARVYEWPGGGAGN